MKWLKRRKVKHRQARRPRLEIDVPHPVVKDASVKLDGKHIEDCVKAVYVKMRAGEAIDVKLELIPQAVKMSVTPGDEQLAMEEVQ